MALHLNLLNIPQHGTAAIQVRTASKRSKIATAGIIKQVWHVAKICLLLSFPQRHYSEEDPDKEQRVKEIELLLMSTEDELRGQPSLPVGHVCVLVKMWDVKVWQHNLCACVFDPGFKDSGWMCVFVWIRRRKHLGGRFLQKWWNRTLTPVFARAHDPLCNPLSNMSVTLYIKVPFLLLFFFVFLFFFVNFYTPSLIVRLAFSLLSLFNTFLYSPYCAHIFRCFFFFQVFF